MSPRFERRIIALAVLVALAGFGLFASITGGKREPRDSPPPLPASRVSLWLSGDQVPPGVELVAILVNHDGVDATFGVFAKIDRWDGQGWVPQGELVMCMDHWHCAARVQRPGEVGAYPAIGLSAELGRPGPIERFTVDGLDVGWYRVSQEANEGLVAAAAFEISVGAPQPAPLVPVDDPALSVTPTLMSPDGGDVDLYPLIPTRTGAQSRQDIERAIEGLSEVARIERWDGRSWEPVGEAKLRPGADSLARSAELPPLREGDYRLVREGPDGPHIGPFWIDAAI
jgi:hypothetical protein